MGKKNYYQLLIICALVMLVWFYGSTTIEVVKVMVASRQVEELEIVEQAEEEEKPPLVIIDPGHGDEDPGKVGVNGALEKDVNLAIGLFANALLVEEGYEVIMTRTDDSGTLDTMEYSATADLMARVDLINESTPDLVVSIHQNSYTQESVKGPQVFYYTGSEEGAKAAQIIQNQLWELDTDSHREIKANDSYYLLANTQPTTVIVECGFLSNANDAEKLIDPVYQEELAKAIVEGVVLYIEE